jgi:hypothetical protein
MAKTSASIEPGQTLTFTVKSLPGREAQRKTIQRLMRMQRSVQNGLRSLSKRRQRDRNRTYQRAGRMWTHRIAATRLAHVAPGEAFTLTVTPQIIPDIRSVEEHLEVRRGT